MKSDPLWPAEILKDRINPFAGVLVDDMKPTDVDEHEAEKSEQTCFYHRIVAMQNDHFQADEHHDVGVYEII